MSPGVYWCVPVLLQAWSPYTALTTLNLSHNALTTLKQQGLAHLVALKSLDLRFNRFESLDVDVVPELEACGSLEVLFLLVLSRVQHRMTCACASSLCLCLRHVTVS